ncbi:hypothetical protein [Klebsiella quasipneumoniae]|jgi:Cu/Ag efflux protein CusF|uniref:hypothetical protein n=1 Tax=Klebsiella quasipneumoniae TaxID=1463165 RepID=UPI0023AEAC57|nr:hypothetical protein [Klebsiella quasipneumoniae]
MKNDHIELVFDGLYDRISGNETYASRYLDGVIWANEPSNMFVSGNEGFLDNVSDGIKKAWEYIKKFIASIKERFSSLLKSKRIEETAKKVDEALKNNDFETSPEVKEKIDKTSKKIKQIISILNSVSEDVDTMKSYIKSDALLSKLIHPYVDVLVSEKDRLVKSLQIIDGKLDDKITRELLIKCLELIESLKGFSSKYVTATNSLQFVISNIERAPQMDKELAAARIKAVKWTLRGLDILGEQVVATLALMERIPTIK